MTLPANLFIDTPETEDVSLHQLSNDSDSWPEDITQKMKERIPSIRGLNIVVKIMKKDEENGAATGSVIVNSTEKSIVVPLIIKDFMLYPLDVMIAEGKLLPLTPAYISAVLSKNEMFDKIEEFPTFGGLGRFEDANLWNAIYPPSMGRYAYASAGGYPILESIADGLDGSELKSFLTEKKNEKIAARLLSGPHKDVVVKLAKLQAVNMNEYRQGIENLIPRSFAMLKVDGPNKYTLLSNSDQVFHPTLTQVDRPTAMGIISKISDRVEDDINEVDQIGEKILMMPSPKNNVILADEDREIVEDAEEFDHYVVKTKNGINLEGVVVPRIIDFDQKLTDMKLFIGKGNQASYQPKIFGVRVKNSRFMPEHGTMKLGQTGTFMFQPDGSHALATVPVTITAIMEDMGEYVIKAVDMLGVTIKLSVSRNDNDRSLKRIAKLDTLHYRIPAVMKWVPLETFHEVSNSEYSYAVKEAATKLTDKPVTLISTGYDQFAMRGVQKYASSMKWDPSNLERYQVKFILGSMGCGETKMASAIHTARVRGYSELHNLSFPKLAYEKVAEVKPLADRLNKIAGKLKSNLLKEASYMDNAQTLDALLSLNFVTPQNITKFISKIPALKSAISHLASCLVASRLGLKEIPEQSASGAMSRLVEVVEGLEKLRAVQQIGE